jgi:hypothetical protein
MSKGYTLFIEPRPWIDAYVMVTEATDEQEIAYEIMTDAAKALIDIMHTRVAKCFRHAGSPLETMEALMAAAVAFHRESLVEFTLYSVPEQLVRLFLRDKKPLRAEMTLEASVSTIRDATYEYFSSERFAHHRSALRWIGVTSYGWNNVLQYIADNPGCAPALTTLCLSPRIFSLGTLQHIPIPVQIRTLNIPASISNHLPLEIPVDEQACKNINATITAASCLKCIEINALLNIADFVNSTIEKATIRCRTFCAKAPRLRELELTTGCTDVIDLAHCQAIIRVFVDNMDPPQYIQILQTAPRIPTRPRSCHPMLRRPTLPYLEDCRIMEEGILAVYAPHLLLQLGLIYHWTPMVHRGFHADVHQLISVFLLGVAYCADTGAIPQYNPAVLETVLRHISAFTSTNPATCL